MSKIGKLILDNMDATPFSVPVDVVAANNSSILWVSPHAASLDPMYAVMCGSDVDTYERHLLRSCALLYEPSSSETIVGSGFFDRYGGDGVGKNGGSGRALNVGSYNVKGVGRSPLVSHATDFAHASGYAFLEEGMREIIMYRALERLLPGQVSPILALIAVDDVVKWPEGSYPPHEQRVLIVRPKVARLAHFELARTYNPREPEERRNDDRRIAAWRDLIEKEMGFAAFFDEVGDTFERWGARYATCISNRWSLGGLSPSNIDIDGRFLDFGGATRLPSVANFSIGYGAWLFDEIQTLKRSATSLVSSITNVALVLNEVHAESERLFQRAYDGFHLSFMNALGMIPKKYEGRWSEFLPTSEGMAAWSVVGEVLEFLKGIRLSLNVPGGPQFDVVREAVLSASIGPENSREGVIGRHLIRSCAGSSADTARGTSTSSHHREALRRHLHDEILSQHHISRRFVSGIIDAFDVA